jgi:hypothetical protein
MPNDDTAWKRCSSCKGSIDFGAIHFTCSVSTCNRKGTDFIFCSVDCWDAHVPVLRHRDAWADEKTAPTAAEWARTQLPDVPSAARQPAPQVTSMDSRGEARARAGGDAVGAGGDAARAPRDVLVVVSKLKLYVRLTSGMNTSDDVIEPLSDTMRRLCDDAVERARAEGRKTVMARDFRRH